MPFASSGAGTRGLRVMRSGAGDQLGRELGLTGLDRCGLAQIGTELTRGALET